MSVIDSRRFRRPDMTHLSLAEFERIKNTPPPDREKMREESRRFVQRVLEASARAMAEGPENDRRAHPQGVAGL